MISPIVIFANNISELRWKTLENHSYLKLNITKEQKQVAMFKNVRNIGVELQQLEGSTLYDNITSVIKDSEDQLLFSDLFKSMIQIDRNFDQLQEYSKEESNVNATTIVQFATETVSHRSTSVKMLMDKIHQYITPKVKYIYHGGLLQIIANNTVSL